MSKTQYLEVVRFNLNANATEEQLFTAENAIRGGMIQQQPGYQGRDLYQDADGSFLMIIRWDNEEAGEAWSPVFMSLPEGQAFGSLMDFASARQEHYTLVNA